MKSAGAAGIRDLVLFGAKGMLGRDVAAAARARNLSVAAYDLPELDLLDPALELDALPACGWIVNCAAYTDVDGAEQHEQAAFAVNAAAVARLAAWAAGRNTPLVHVSTDYVFDGTARAPYGEDAPTRPLNAYGRSKLAGEQAVLESGCRHLIVRTQSLFGLHGRNFVKAILDRLAAGQPLRVVADQVSCPTYTGHLADAIFRLMGCGREGIVHASSTGSCTWHAFACAIAAGVGSEAAIEPCTSEAFPRPARRPAYSVLDKARYEAWTGHAMPTWEQALHDYLEAGGAGRAAPAGMRSGADR